MNVWMIWAREDGMIWLEEAWDDDTRQCNIEAWRDKVKSAKARYQEVVVTQSWLDFAMVEKAFDRVSDTGELVITE